MATSNPYMSSYWKGYRRCRYLADRIGLENAYREIYYSSCSEPYAQGAKRYYQRVKANHGWS